MTAHVEEEFHLFLVVEPLHHQVAVYPELFLVFFGEPEHDLLPRAPARRRDGLPGGATAYPTARRLTRRSGRLYRRAVAHPYTPMRSR